MKHKYGVVVGRFQPFHNGHLDYIKKALKRCEVLFIGITTPGEVATQYEPKDKKRLGRANNPFKYKERKEMIVAVLRETGVDLGSVQFVPFVPSNIDNWYKKVPKGAIYFLLLLSKDDEKKVKEMEAQGLIVEVLERKHERGHIGEDIRDRMAKGKDWRHLVPKSVALYLEQINAKERLCN